MDVIKLLWNSSPIVWYSVGALFLFFAFERDTKSLSFGYPRIHIFQSESILLIILFIFFLGPSYLFDWLLFRLLRYLNEQEAKKSLKKGDFVYRLANIIMEYRDKYRFFIIGTDYVSCTNNYEDLRNIYTLIDFYHEHLPSLSYVKTEALTELLADQLCEYFDIIDIGVFEEYPDGMLILERLNAPNVKNVLYSGSDDVREIKQNTKTMYSLIDSYYNSAANTIKLVDIITKIYNFFIDELFVEFYPDRTAKVTDISSRLNVLGASGLLNSETVNAIFILQDYQGRLKMSPNLTESDANTIFESLETVVNAYNTIMLHKKELKQQLLKQEQASIRPDNTEIYNGIVKIEELYRSGYYDEAANNIRKVLELILIDFISEYAPECLVDSNIDKINKLSELSVFSNHYTSSCHFLRKIGNKGSHVGESVTQDDISQSLPIIKDLVSFYESKIH